MVWALILIGSLGLVVRVAWQQINSPNRKASSLSFNIQEKAFIGFCRFEFYNHLAILNGRHTNIIEEEEAIWYA